MPKVKHTLFASQYIFILTDINTAFRHKYHTFILMTIFDFERALRAEEHV